MMDDEIRSRVGAQTKADLVAIAKGRELSVSDVTREALREYIAARRGSLQFARREPLAQVGAIEPFIQDPASNG